MVECIVDAFGESNCEVINIKEEKNMSDVNQFVELNKVDVSAKIEKKNGLSYLSWAFAWQELKKRYPKAIRTVYETENGVNYWNDGKTAWVKVGITIEGIEEIDYLPIMDFRNKSIKLDAITSFDVNKAIMRSTVKAIGLHGLGLYVYAGEDLPENDENSKDDKKSIPKKSTASTKSDDKATKAQVEELKVLAKKAGVTDARMKEKYGNFIYSTPFMNSYNKAKKELEAHIGKK